MYPLAIRLPAGKGAPLRAGFSALLAGTSASIFLGILALLLLAIVVLSLVGLLIVVGIIYFVYSRCNGESGAASSVAAAAPRPAVDGIHSPIKPPKPNPTEEEEALCKSVPRLPAP